VMMRRMIAMPVAMMVPALMTQLPGLTVNWVEVVVPS